MSKRAGKGRGKGHGKDKRHGESGGPGGGGNAETDAEGHLVPAAKFPRTAHLFDAGVQSGVATTAVTRDDLLWDVKDVARLFYKSGLLVSLVRAAQCHTVAVSGDGTLAQRSRGVSPTVLTLYRVVHAWVGGFYW